MSRRQVKISQCFFLKIVKFGLVVCSCLPLLKVNAYGKRGAQAGTIYSRLCCVDGEVVSVFLQRISNQGIVCLWGKYSDHGMQRPPLKDLVALFIHTFFAFNEYTMVVYFPCRIQNKACLYFLSKHFYDGSVYGNTIQ